MSFNDSQKRRIWASFKYIDEGVNDALRAIRAIPTECPVCPEYVADATPEQRVVLGEQAAIVRTILRAFIDRHQIRQPPSASAVGAFATTLAFLRIALHELLPPDLANFGVVSPESAAAIITLVAELARPIAKMTAICHTGDCKVEQDCA